MQKDEVPDSALRIDTKEILHGKRIIQDEGNSMITVAYEKERLAHDLFRSECGHRVSRAGAPAGMTLGAIVKLITLVSHALRGECYASGQGSQSL